MLPVNRHLLPVIGIDIHVVLVPAPPAPPIPVPTPHPFIGIVMDIMDYIPYIGATLSVNNCKRGLSFTSGMLGCKVHIPIGGVSFLTPPMIGHDAYNFFGSLTVSGEGNLLSPAGYMAMTCNDFGVPLTLQPPPEKGFWPPVPSRYLPLSTTIPIPAGPPVNVGGPYVPDLKAMVMSLAFSFGFGALIRGAGMALRRAIVALNRFLKKFRCTRGLSRSLCRMGFEPVDLVTGRVIYDGIDFEIPGPIPVKWERSWYSDSGYEGMLGYGTHVCYDLTLYTDYQGDYIGVILPDGRATTFPLLNTKGENSYNRPEKLTLTYNGEGFELMDHNQNLTYVFEKTTLNTYKPVKLADRRGFSILFNYDTKGKLIHLIDAVGRNIQLEYDEVGRVVEITTHYKGEERILVQYGYNMDNDLSKITDALGKTTNIRYQNHLMVEKTDRNGQTFYWEYDGETTGARCIHTGGEGGLMEGWISYKEGYNEVIDALGGTTLYYYNHLNLCTRITDPLGNSKEYEYTEDMELYREIDEEGNCTGFTYDNRGNKTSIQLPDGSIEKYIYNGDDQIQLKIDALNQIYVYNYNEQKLLKSVSAPDKSTLFYRYGETNQLEMVENENFQTTSLSYDSDFNLSKIMLSDGSSTEWFYDKWGRCIQILNPENKSQYFQYDDLDRVIAIKQFDKNLIQLKYNAYDEVVFAEDKHSRVKYTYNALGSLLSRKENGTTVMFHHDTNNQLKAIRNEHNELFSFVRNQKGDIVSEIGFDGLTRHFQRDRSGKVICTDRPGGKWTVNEFDAVGRLIRAEYSDGTWETFSYNRKGQLIEACNEASSLQMVRDEMGRVIQEKSGVHWVESKYNKIGERIKVTSSLGAEIDQEYNEGSQVNKTQVRINGKETWEANYQYNSLGLEIERTLPGGVYISRSYDAASRPLNQKVSVNNRETLSRSYAWNVNDRLTRMVNELTNGTVNYGHDEFSNLAWAKYENGEFDYRLPDAVGNIYKTESRNDRKYGPGGKLLQSEGNVYDYDEEGNLIYKKEKNGKEWHYQWKGNGILDQVIRPDNKKVQFEYDALGRRTSKTFDGSITKWLWDGNVPLHEWQYQEKNKPKPIINKFGELDFDLSEPITNLVSWIFDERSFKPAAKIIADNTYSIITDYMGTPVEIYDKEGEKTWQVDYDIQGKIRNLKTGSLDDCPFRYQGQYEDVETGLYYNRFRYYSPEEGIYISQDPIGLAGGNPTLYGYVVNTNCITDIFGLSPSPISGFNSFGQLNQFGTQIQATLAKGGYPGSDIFMQGSSVTGRSFSTGIPFDVGRVSDFDVAIANPDLLARAQGLDLGKPGRPYSVPLDADAMRRLGFGDLADDLSRRFGRDVNFRIYDSEASVRAQGKSYKIKCG